MSTFRATISASLAISAANRNGRNATPIEVSGVT
jgi:hypothetical protein